jgi:hypothetical protein
VLDGAALTPRRAGAVLLLGVMGTGVAYALNYRIIGEQGATTAALTTYIVPVVAVVVGVVVLDEPFEWRLLLGGALTVAGIVAVTRGPDAWRSLTARAPAWTGRADRRGGPAAVHAGVASGGLDGRGDGTGRAGAHHPDDGGEVESSTGPGSDPTTR